LILIILETSYTSIDEIPRS